LDTPRTPPPHGESHGRTVFTLSILAGTLFLPIGLHLPYFPAWLAARGFSDSEIAAALALPMVLRVIATPIVAAIADRRGIAVTLAACAAAAFAGYCALGFVNRFTPVFIGAVLVATALGLMPSLADALTLAGIRRAEMAGFGRIAYGRIRVWTSISVLSTMLLSGWIVGHFPGERIVSLAGLTLLPALAALLAAAKMKNLHYHGLPKGGLTGDPARLRLALVFIGAAALIQASHAEIYSFATLHWKATGLPPKFIGAAWAIGVASESLLFLLTTEKNAASFLVLGAAGAVVRWLAMSADPGPLWLIVLQAMHGLSFSATYFGSVLLLGGIARETHSARMQGWLAATSALSLALGTFACGRLTSLYGERTYLAMAGLAMAGLMLALVAAALKRQIET
jgi:PPP family 3-phenylpropionic acid transporter